MYENLESEFKQMQDVNAVNSYQQTTGLCGANARAYTMAEENEKNAAYHAEKAQQLSQGALFLKEHPEFEQFIKLIRSGAIQF